MKKVFSGDLLKGKKAVVTGAGKGIGAECALLLASAGAEVLAVARTQQDLDRVVALYPERIKAWCADATTDAFFKELEACEQLDILVNNVGTNAPQAVVDVSTDNLDRMLNLNVRSVFLASQAGIRNMLKRNVKGSVINISSQMGHIGSANRSVYCTTKHAIEGMTKAMAVELAPEGIRVNSVAPTFVETPLTKPMLQDPEFNAFVLNNIPMAQIAKTEDVANAVVYLASEASSMVTGTSLKVDGGWTAW